MPHPNPFSSSEEADGEKVASVAYRSVSSLLMLVVATPNSYSNLFPPKWVCVAVFLAFPSMYPSPIFSVKGKFPFTLNANLFGIKIALQSA